MIFFFTGSGNSLAAAETIAEQTKDDLVDIGMAYKHGIFDFTIPQGKNLGFVFPVYAWTTPKIVDEFLTNLRISTTSGGSFKPGYSFCVLTCGGFCGNTARFFAEEARRLQGIEVDAAFSVKSVGTCVYLYDMPDADKRAFKLEEARREALEVAHMIRNKRRGFREDRNPVGILMSRFTCRGEKSFGTEKFTALGTCTGCGRCASLCPTGTIELVDGKPAWTGTDCTQCLGCVHRCPVAAIQYGDSTRGRRRFVNPALEKDLPTLEAREAADI